MWDSSDDSPDDYNTYDDYDYDYDYGDDEHYSDIVHPVVGFRRESSESSLEVTDTFTEKRSTKRLLPLKELCCRFVGQNFPFGTVQMYPSRVPEDVQKRISFWSFPLEEKKLLDYAKVIGGANEYDVEMAKKNKVRNMIQSGMYLTGTISPSTDYYRGYRGDEERQCFRAYVQFDRGCITTAKCSCDEQNWCRHVLALCLARVNESAPLQLHPPISETLTNLGREQLQKLVQYALEKLPLHGVVAVQEIACSLLDRESEINQISGAPDLTAGGCSSDKPVWQMDRNIIINRLNSAYEQKVSRRSYPYYDSTTCLENRKAALMGFKEFTSGYTPNTTSEFHTLLQYEDDNLAIVLKWALEKVAIKPSKAAHPSRPFFQENIMTKEMKWSEWCFCRMLLPVVQMFFVSPAMSTTGKEDVTECLAQCMQQDLSKPIIELLRTFQQIATSGVFADAQGCRTLLTCLQQAATGNLSLHPHDKSMKEVAGSDASLLHCAIAVVQYKLFYNSVCAPEIEDMPVAICHLLFPAVLTDAAALEDLVAIRSDHGLQEMSVPLLLDYGTALLQCTSTPDLSAELVFKLIGNQILLNNASNTDVLVFRNWAENAMITAVDEAKTLIKASPEVKSKLADLSIKWLRQTSFTLERDPNPTATLTGMWRVMRLVCRCATDSDDCLEVVKQMTQELIDVMPSTLPETTPPDATRDAAKDINLPVDVMADSFTGLLVDLFTMLPAGGSQELFTTLYKVYPKPVDAKRSLEMGRCEYDEWQLDLLDRAKALSHHLSFAFFPKEPSMEDFEELLQDNSQEYRGSKRVCRRSNSRPKSQREKAEIVQFCRVQCSVSSSHISFLQQLHKCLKAVGAPLQFQVQLLIAQVSLCRNYAYNWAHGGVHYGDYHELHDFLLACDDIGSSLQALKDTWKFSVDPDKVLQLLEAVQDKVTSQNTDVMYNILISVLDCKASHYPRIFAIMLKIGANPEHILQAVTLIICSISNSNDSQHRTIVIQCAEALGKAYNQHKALGTAKEALEKLRVKAVDLLHQATSMPEAIGRSTHLEYAYVCRSQSVGVDLQSVSKVVRDSGPQTWADVLALLVVNPDEYLLPILSQFNSYCHKNAPGPSSQYRPLQVPPFREAVARLMERRKRDIKKIASTYQEISGVRHLLDDLRASYQFWGDEAAFTTFMEDLTAMLKKAKRWLVMPWNMDWDREDFD